MPWIEDVQNVIGIQEVIQASTVIRVGVTQNQSINGFTLWQFVILSQVLRSCLVAIYSAKVGGITAVDDDVEAFKATVARAAVVARFNPDAVSGADVVVVNLEGRNRAERGWASRNGMGA